MKVPVIHALSFAVVLSAAACSNDTAAPNQQLDEVAAVVPGDGAVGVDPSAPVIIDFTYAMMPGMEQHMALHEGDKSGPVVQGTWKWSSDYKRLSFVPVAGLKPRTRYTVHMGMDMIDGVMEGSHDQHHTNQSGDHMGGTAGSMMSGSSSMMRGSHDTATCVMLSSFVTA